MVINAYFQSIDAFKDKQVIKVLTGIRNINAPDFLTGKEKLGF